MKKGFTLTEILIVLVIAGILLALILPNSVKAIAYSNRAANNANVQSCNTGVGLCFSERNRDWTQCDSMDELVAGGFLKEAPEGVAVVADPDTGGFTCN